MLSFQGGGGGRLFEAGRLLTFLTYRVGAYSRWALIRGWALNRINTVCFFMGITIILLQLVPGPTFFLRRMTGLLLNKSVSGVAGR